MIGKFCNYTFSAYEECQNYVFSPTRDIIVEMATVEDEQGRNNEIVYIYAGKTSKRTIKESDGQGLIWLINNHG